jgi:heme-degrading monooxygenase HmoA
VAEGYETMFEERFRQRAGQIEKQPGFLRMQVLQPAKPGLPYVVQTSWQDRTAFESWVGSEDFRNAHANPMPKEAFDGEGGIEMHEVIISAEATP